MNAWSWIGWSLVTVGSYITAASVALAIGHEVVERKAWKYGDPYDVFGAEADDD
ncbi:hypothetical protein [Nonomuraea rubra]|uniref:Uncharacterized protein n=1 Tax=Nonomuraea rubra TaxID=46180 RepID=A0A7X0P6M1_9ACTN|nr:hypothetical protein [Nonomuraea rubra]MBB6556226.1 hypothetical protein [Nonomuraea rubra]